MLCISFYFKSAGVLDLSAASGINLGFQLGIRKCMPLEFRRLVGYYECDARHIAKLSQPSFGNVIPYSLRFSSYKP